MRGEIHINKYIEEPTNTDNNEEEEGEESDKKEREATRKDGSVDWGKLQYAYEFNYSGSALGNSGTEGPESFQESG